MKGKKQAKGSKVVVAASWERVGRVGVDSGQLMVCDPCYVDSQWVRDTEPPGHKTIVPTAAGRRHWKGLPKGWSATFPFEWGTYADVAPALGMSVSDALAAKLLEFAPESPPSRAFSYRGACEVSGKMGGDFGQLENGIGVPIAVAFSSGFGDGVYDVLAQRNKDGRIVEVRVVLIDDGPENRFKARMLGESEDEE